MRFRFSNFFWGLFLIGLAAFLIMNQLQDFTQLGLGSLIGAFLAAVILFYCLIYLQFTYLPIPLAILYFVFGSYLGLPEIPTWTVILATILAVIGLSYIFQRSHFHVRAPFVHVKGGKHKIHTEESSNDNNPSVSVSFGSVSRRLSADSLESAQLDCNFGALEVYFDKVELNPNGAEVNINCKCGGIELYIPRSWHVIDKTSCAMGGVDVANCFAAPGENVPRLTLTGNISIGGMEVRGL